MSISRCICIKFPPMEDDVAPNALVEEGSHHVEEDVEDPEEVHDKTSYYVSVSVINHQAFHNYDHDEWFDWI